MNVRRSIQAASLEPKNTALCDTGLTQAEAHEHKGKHIKDAMAQPPLYNVLTTGRPTKDRRMWAIKTYVVAQHGARWILQN